jgi:hypothetical protein
LDWQLTLIAVGLLVAAGQAHAQLPPISESPQVDLLLHEPEMHGVPSTQYFDLDAWLEEIAGPRVRRDDWSWQFLPEGLIYKSYLAGAKESRLGTQIFSVDGDGTLWDATLGGRIGILRFGTTEAAWPHGWQFDLEGSGQVRLAPNDERELRSADFRAGGGFTYGYGPHRLRLGYYHISSHLGDEFLLRNPGFQRINWVRDALNLGYSYYWTDDLRLYAETSWAFYGDFTGNWDFQFGIDYAPARPTGIYGAPFFAINGHLRQELNYSGNLVVQAGWAWRGDHTGYLLRTGLHYYNGLSNQYSFYRNFEQQIGAGVWLDY